MTLPFAIGRRFFLFLLVAVIFDPVRCTTPTTGVLGADFPPAIVITEGKTPQGFSYLMGGVGSDERAAMEEKSKAFNLRLVFADRRGPYLSDVKLVIEDSRKAEVISLTTNGPWFFIQLPPGRYGVRATFKGQTQSIDALNIGKEQLVRQTLTWDSGEGS
jgi:hypothetical protein